MRFRKCLTKMHRKKNNRQFICKTGFGLCLGYSNWQLCLHPETIRHGCLTSYSCFLLGLSQLWKGFFLLWNYALEIVIHELFDVIFEGLAFWCYICGAMLGVSQHLSVKNLVSCKLKSAFKLQNMKFKTHHTPLSKQFDGQKMEIWNLSSVNFFRF